MADILSSFQQMSAFRLIIITSRQ